jgi:hypothetical protein
MTTKSSSTGGLAVECEAVEDGIGDCRITEHCRILQFLIGP